MIIRTIDVETCGLPPDNNQVVEVATLDLVAHQTDDRMVWTRDRMWSSLVNPGRPIPPEASGVHHITDDMVKDAPSMDDALKEQITQLVPDCYAAHEARFEAVCLPWLTVKWICTRKCAATLWPDAPNHKNQTLRYWLGLKLADPSLAVPHRAPGDAYVTAAILRRVLSQITVEEAITISANPVLLQKFNFGEHALKPIDDVPTSYLDWIVNKSKGPWDDDVMFTARQHLGHRRSTERNRSPV